MSQWLAQASIVEILENILGTRPRDMTGSVDEGVRTGLTGTWKTTHCCYCSIEFDVIASICDQMYAVVSGKRIVLKEVRQNCTLIGLTVWR